MRDAPTPRRDLAQSAGWATRHPPSAWPGGGATVGSLEMSGGWRAHPHTLPSPSSLPLHATLVVPCLTATLSYWAPLLAMGTGASKAFTPRPNPPPRLAEAGRPAGTCHTQPACAWGKRSRLVVEAQRLRKLPRSLDFIALLQGDSLGPGCKRSEVVVVKIGSPI